MGTFRNGKSDNETATLSDFMPDTMEEVGNRLLRTTEMEPEDRPPPAVGFAKRSIRGRNLVRSMVSSQRIQPKRESALCPLLMRNGECTGVFNVPFYSSIWGRVTIDYVQKSADGVWRLIQLRSKSDGL